MSRPENDLADTIMLEIEASVGTIPTNTFAPWLRGLCYAALIAERERAAKVAEDFRDGNPYPNVYAAIAHAIRNPT